MKILKLSWPSYGDKSIERAFGRSGINCVSVPYAYEGDERDWDRSLESVRDAVRQHGPDAVFMFNFSRPVAVVCRDEGIPYLSWVYDSPIYRLRSEEMTFETNRIMLFDSWEVQEFRKMGLNNIFWLPLASDPAAAQSVIKNYKGRSTDHKSEISFVGRFYGVRKEGERWYKNIKDLLPPFWHGYLEGIMDCQHRIYGDNIIQRCMNPDISGVLVSILGDNPDGKYDTNENRFANLLINMELSSRERLDYICAVARNYPLALYTTDDHPDIPGAEFRGTVHPDKLAPVVENRSRINLNISLRSIKNGVPLRIFDILAAGGFMLSNYQSDIDTLFNIGRDLVTFDSEEDLLKKCGYYLEHEDERREIAENGFKAVRENHTYEHRVAEMVTFL